MDDLGTFERKGEAIDLRYERHYPHPIETVWAALTEPARIGDWLGKAVVEPRVGGRFELMIDQPKPVIGRVVAWEPPRLLSYSWDTGDGPPSTVRCELTADGAGTRLVFLHTGIGHAWLGLVLPGWHTHLERMASLMRGEVLGFVMPRWRELQAIYFDRYKLDGVMVDPPAGCG